MTSDLRFFLDERRVGSRSIRFGMSLSARGWGERAAAMLPFFSFFLSSYLFLGRGGFNYFGVEFVLIIILALETV